MRSRCGSASGLVCAVVAAALAPGLSCADGQSVIADIPALQSTCVYQGEPAANFGSGDRLRLGFDGPDQEWLSYVQWDIEGSIPAGSEIVAVNILFEKDCSLLWGVEEYTIAIVRIEWDEDTVTWETRAQLQDTPTIVGIGFVGDCDTSGQEWRLVFSVLGTWVQAVLDGQIPNGGLEFRGRYETTGQVRMLSEEGGASPRLLVEYIPPPCPFDLNTRNTNPGEPGYGEPDGIIDGFDLSFFVEMWLNNAPEADLTSTNSSPGSPGYGSPDGKIDGADLSYFVEGWLAGCQ